MKICKECKIEKSDDSFYKTIKKDTGKQYLKNVCNKCSSKKYVTQNKEWKKNNPEKVKEWKKNNPEKVKNSKRKYSERHKKEHSAYMKKYFQEHKEEQKDRMSKYQKSHPEVFARHTHNHNAAKRKAPGKIGKDDIKILTEAQVGKCLMCGKKAKLTVDHIVPLSKGGSNEITNLQMLCQPCNSKKKDTTNDCRTKSILKRIFMQGEIF